MTDLKQDGKIYIEDIFDENDNVEVLSYIPHLTIKENDNSKLIYLFFNYINIHHLNIFY